MFKLKGIKGNKCSKVKVVIKRKACKVKKRASIARLNRIKQDWGFLLRIYILSGDIKAIKDRLKKASKREIRVLADICTKICR